MQERTLFTWGLKGPAGLGMGPLSLSHIPKGKASLRPSSTQPWAPSSPTGSLEMPLLIVQSTNTCLFENITENNNKNI